MYLRGCASTCDSSCVNSSFQEIQPVLNSVFHGEINGDGVKFTSDLSSTCIQIPKNDADINNVDSTPSQETRKGSFSRPKSVKREASRTFSPSSLAQASREDFVMFLLLILISFIMLCHVHGLKVLSNRIVSTKIHHGALTRLYGGATSTSIMENPIKMKNMHAKELLDKTDVFIFDCDGVIWKGDSLIDGVPQVLDKLRAMGKMIFFVTNNSTKSRKGYLKKFTSLGLNVKPEGNFYIIILDTSFIF